MNYDRETDLILSARFIELLLDFGELVPQRFVATVEVKLCLKLAHLLLDFLALDTDQCLELSIEAVDFRPGQLIFGCIRNDLFSRHDSDVVLVLRLFGTLTSFKSISSCVYKLILMRDFLFLDLFGLALQDIFK